MTQPASRGWSGSVLIHTDRCSLPGISAWTQHRLPVPQRPRTVSVTVDVYGGPSVGFPEARGVTTAFGRRHAQLDAALGWHRIDHITRDAGFDLHRLRALSLTVFARHGSSYDLRDFKITVRYRTLEAV